MFQKVFPKSLLSFGFILKLIIKNNSNNHYYYKEKVVTVSRGSHTVTQNSGFYKPLG